MVVVAADVDGYSVGSIAELVRIGRVDVVMPGASDAMVEVMVFPVVWDGQHFGELVERNGVVDRRDLGNRDRVLVKVLVLCMNIKWKRIHDYFIILLFNKVIL